jgi:hypothetical protein
MLVCATVTVPALSGRIARELSARRALERSGLLELRREQARLVERELGSRESAMKEPHSSDDISAILRRWGYQDEDAEKNIRRVRMPNGREVLQVRLPLGIEQYELHGRPDGLKPEGFESWFELYHHQANVYGREFVLDDESCSRLHSEGMLYYYRYLRLFQIQDYELCLRDTSRNLRLLEFVKSHAGKQEHVDMLCQYRPYILRMQIMSRALMRIKEREDCRGALRILKKGLEEIRSLPEIPGNEIFQFEQSRSISSLDDLIRQIERQAHVQAPLTRKEKLLKQLEEAVVKEDYERAALIRDKLRRIDAEKKSS